MDKNYKELKWYHGVILLMITAFIIFFVGPLFSMEMGLYGTLCSELLMLGAAVLAAVIGKDDLRKVFPIRKPRISGCIGVLLMWIGSFLIVMVLTMVIAVFFPEEIFGTSSGLSAAFTSVPFLASFLIVAVAPSVCEEAVFRGVLIRSFGAFKNKWIVIVISGVIFGLFHGSVWRFVPTALLGMMLGYIFIESNNMVYNGLFHGLNNALPLVLSYAMKDVYEQMYNQTDMLMDNMESPLFSVTLVGTYLLYTAIAPGCLYLGNYLLHRGKPGYRETLFPSGKPWIILLLVGLSLSCIVVGIGLMLYGIVRQPNIFAW